MSAAEMDDPEAPYRRGYEQGAHAALEAAGGVLLVLPNGWERLRHWVDVELRRWRFLDRPTDRTVSPPAPPN